MTQTDKQISLQTSTPNHTERIDELIALFNNAIAEVTPPTISLHFSTSEAYPLTMEEFSRFMAESLNIGEECDVEWQHTIDATLGDAVRLIVR